MSFKRKLGRLGAPAPAKGGGRSPAPVDPGAERRLERIDTLRAALDAMSSRERRRERRRPSSPKREAPTAPLPGARRQTPHGEVHVVDTYLEPDHHHGAAPVRAALDVAPGAVARLALDPSLESVDYRRMLFLDTETTGLAGGTGTIPFLIGMAFFEDESLRVEQLFLPGLGQEAPMLHLLAQRLSEASCVVSYNGKSFDWPLLRTRFVMNRVKAPPLPPHLDLLHSARRIFKPRMGSVRLVEMEREVLGMYREDDVAGSEIPAIYLSYLRGREAPRLSGIIDHNAHDLVALAALLARMVEHFEEVRAAVDPLDHLAYARVAERAGDACRAVEFARAAAAGGGDDACTVEARMLEARLARRRGDLSAEERALLDALESSEPDLLGAHVRLELSKLYEHRLKDLDRALEHARHTRPHEDEAASAKRVARLERRLSRAPSRPQLAATEGSPSSGRGAAPSSS